MSDNLRGRVQRAVSRALGHDKLNRLVDTSRLGARSDRYAALVSLRGLGLSSDYFREGAGFAPHEARVFSQNGEDGVLAELFARVGVSSGRFVEFGIQDGREGNAVFLADVAGWSGLFFEPDTDAYAQLYEKYAHSPRIRTRQEAVRPDKLDSVLQEEGFFNELDLLSIDVDGEDYWIWREASVRPRVVVIEYNAALGLRPIVQPPTPWDSIHVWDGTDAFGASLAALEALGRQKGYRLVYCELAGVNAFFVRSDVAERAGLGSVSPEQAYRPPNYALEGRRHPKGPNLRWVTVDDYGEPQID